MSAHILLELHSFMEIVDMFKDDPKNLDAVIRNFKAQYKLPPLANDWERWEREVVYPKEILETYQHICSLHDSYKTTQNK